MQTITIRSENKPLQPKSDVGELGLEGRVALVTGAAAGIGRATA